MPTTYYRCPQGHVFSYWRNQYYDAAPTCRHCDNEEIVPLVTASVADLLAAAERELHPASDSLFHFGDNEEAHILADQALLAALRPSDPDFVARYERLKESFWYA